MSTVETDSSDGPTVSGVPGTDTRVGKAIFAVSVVLALIGIFWVWRKNVVALKYVNAHLGVAFLLYLLVEVYREGDPREWSRRTWLVMGVFALAMVGGMVGSLYVQVFFDELNYERYSRYLLQDEVAGALLLFAVIVGTQRAFGTAIASVAVVALLFARYGQFLPGLFYHQGIPWSRVITLTTVEFNGVFHFILQVGATWIFVFLLWAGLIEEFGGLDKILDLGFLVGNRFSSGIAQTAVVSSMFMGSITGSPIANIVVTGSFTIPLMKERGIKSEIAGAIEAVASTGGQILPPVMGTVAFLMANFLALSYRDIIIAATLPALLFYVSVAVSVHLLVSRFDVDAQVTGDPDTGNLFDGLAPMALSLVVLLYLLIGLGYTPGTAGVWTIAVLVAAELARRLLVEEASVATVTTFVVDVAKGLRRGSVRMVPLTVVLAAMGVIISSFSITGLGYRLSLSIVDVAGGNLILLLLLVMFSSLLLGLGMPTPAAYIITVTLIAPAMVEVGFAAITAHFFVFYFALLASLTPPIALAAAVASRLAEAEFKDVAFAALKLGLPLFLLPFVFAFNQDLIVVNGTDTLVTFAVTLVGFLVIIVGLHRSFETPQGLALRSGIFASGVAITFHTSLFDALASL